MKRAVFIERDGVLNLPKVEGQYQIAPRSASELSDAGFLLIATTNQPGISRGYISRREIDLMHQIISKTFPLNDILMCPHDDADRCPCRKPKPGLFREAAFSHQLLLDHSFVISDKWQDAKAAQNAGCTSILLKSPWNGDGHHDFIVQNCEIAAARILQLQRANQFSYAS
jgi:D-glycero-D-manno-heptose 1,7-bisphosphate phosphatase